MAHVVTFSLQIVAVLAEHPRFLDSVCYQINGLVVVFLALSLIWGVMELIGVCFRRSEFRRRRRIADAFPAALAPMSTLQPIPREIMVVIAAAVVFMMKGQPHRISQVSVAEPTDWGREGRREIFASHRIR